MQDRPPRLVVVVRVLDLLVNEKADEPGPHCDDDRLAVNGAPLACARAAALFWRCRVGKPQNCAPPMSPRAFC